MATETYVVHISEIPEGVKEIDIKNYFKAKLDVDVRIGTMRPVRNSEIPLQWARVDFRSDEAYQKAIEELRFPQFVPGISSRLLPNNRDIISKDIAEKNVFVKGLDKVKYDNEELYDLFKQFGAISASKVSKTVKKQDNKIVSESNGYGFIKFAETENAQEVLEKLELDDPNIVVEPYLKERKKPVSNNLYVKNFPSDYDEEKLKELFNKYGEITSVKIISDEATSKKFGYVCFKDQAAADAALELHDSMIEEGTALYVQRHEKKSLRREELNKKFKKQNLFVTNFGDNVTEEILKDFFSQYGLIKNVKVLTKKIEINGEVVEASKCKGFVCFEDPVDAKRVLEEAKTQGIWFDSKRLNVTTYESKLERQMNSTGRTTTSANPDIEQFILQFLQQISQGGLANMPMMSNPPPMPIGMPQQPNRTNYPSKMPMVSRPRTDPTMRGDMYAQRPGPQPMPGYGGGFPGAGGFNPSGMGMMQPSPYKQDFAPKMMPPTGMVNMMQAAPMPPITAVSEDAMYQQQYNELLNSLDYQQSTEDEKRNK